MHTCKKATRQVSKLQECMEQRRQQINHAKSKKPSKKQVSNLQESLQLQKQEQKQTERDDSHM